MSSKKIINSIQFLRGIAALAVVVHHTGGYVKRYFEPTVLLGDYFSIGFGGVDLFFVISGFIIHFTSKKYLDKPAKLGEYLQKRFVRVFPIHWFILTLLFATGWLITNVFHRDIFSIGYPHTLNAYAQTYFLFPLHFAINPVTWTLSYELFFYLIFALLIISKRLWVIPAGILVISGYQVFQNYLVNGGGAELTYFNFIFSGYNFEFMLGFLIYQFYDKLKIDNIPSVFLLIFGLSIFIGFGYRVSDFDNYKRVLFFGFPSALIVLAMLNLEKNEAISIPKFWILLGDSSYSLYLIHFPIMLLMNKLPQILEYSFTANQEVFYSYFIILTIIFSSIIVHKYIEKPLSKSVGKLIDV
ncbi:MAG: acyltransferase [Arcicella sp.]|nr:acyltransferase [Arcicella sp.]